MRRLAWLFLAGLFVATFLPLTSARQAVARPQYWTAYQKVFKPPGNVTCHVCH